MDGWQALGDRLQLIFAGEAGVYRACTDDQGAMTQTDFFGTFPQGLGLDCGETAFIGALNLAIEQQFQSFTLAGFVRGEYYSHAPQMAYWSFAVGSAVDVPLGAAR